ncbi:uncharacterized protein LOC110443589 [Mizuhopecten yessoensis]|uniref:Uncharacterized protein n=1 Tax=Mizuhopecten yessoensis TaxID=6573 RepID=A0A210PEH3_MIZYE|nr:uncharacterized protein LOC110443589 [Mizuhopecten yessoensis]OWF34888.1 hypothetical protein KP79_PYT08706 [Mizuhopecten yessoensis]
MRHKVKLPLILQCIVFLGACMLAYTGTLPGLHMEMESVCVDGAAILVSLHALTTTPVSCTVWYKDLERSRSIANKTEPIMVTENNVTLGNLKKTTQYLVHVICDDNESLQKTVLTGKCLPDQRSNSNRDDGPNVIYKEQAIFSSSAVDIILGLMFSVAAIITVTMTAYYMYRKYQRRRRLQQFLRTPHTDPFESLQSYMEDDS